MIPMATNKGQLTLMTCTCIVTSALWLFAATLLFTQAAPAIADTPSGPTTSEIAKLPAPSMPHNLFLALNGGDLGYFSALLVAGADPNARDSESGRTLLMASEKAAVTQLLLAHGADPTLKDFQGATALHYAITSSESLKIIPFLLAGGADVNAKAPGLSLETPLMVAKKLFYQHETIHGGKVMKLLAQNGADINAADENGYTLLISAVVNDKPELVRLMLELGADADQQANDGLTAMSWAIELGFVDIIELLEAAQP